MKTQIHKSVLKKIPQHPLIDPATGYALVFPDWYFYINKQVRLVLMSSSCGEGGKTLAMGLHVVKMLYEKPCTILACREIMKDLSESSMAVVKNWIKHPAAERLYDPKMKIHGWREDDFKIVQSRIICKCTRYTFVVYHRAVVLHIVSNPLRESTLCGSMKDNIYQKKVTDLSLALFGGPKLRGGVQFLDAYPNSNVCFATDIMNPHYPKSRRQRLHHNADARPGRLWNLQKKFPKTFNTTIANVYAI